MSGTNVHSSFPGLSESAIRQASSGESFRRGEAYYRRGAVVSLVRRGDDLRAEVEGSAYAPYQVRVSLDQAGVAAAACSCPYDWGGWCKHIVAALLACLRDAGAVEVRPLLDALLADLGTEQLRDLVLALAARDPDLIDEIERHVELKRSAGDAHRAAGAPVPFARRTRVDAQAVRRRVAGILHSLDRMRPSEAYWQVDSVVSQIGEVLGDAMAFAEAGDGENALSLLEAITDEYAEGWLALDDSGGHASGFLSTLGEAWTEAALTADLAIEERKRWADKLTRWQAKVDDYGIDGAFDAAQAAFLHGWDHPPLRRVLAGETTEGGTWEGESPWYAEELTAARLKVLERQGRYDEYLNVSRAEGEMASYVLMLARLGRLEEAVIEGLQHLHAPHEVLALAQALRDQGELTAALRVAEHGLSLDGHKEQLATWLCELAQGLGQGKLALRAACVAFQSNPSMDTYLRVQRLAGQRWPALRAKLLDFLRQGQRGFGGGHVEVMLHEGLWDEAIAAAESDGGYGLLERVMDAVIDQRPEWVIDASRRQAERIMDAGKAKHYDHAVAWLERMRAAYRAAGREGEWRAYLDQVRTLHGRKYKLMGMLRGIESD